MVLAIVVTWVARLMAVVLLGLVGFIFVFEGLSEGFPDPSQLTAGENAGLGLLLLMAVGLIAAFRWPVAGALLTIAAYAAFCVIEGGILLGLFPVFVVVAILNLLSAGLRPKEG